MTQIGLSLWTLSVWQKNLAKIDIYHLYPMPMDNLRLSLVDF